MERTSVMSPKHRVQKLGLALIAAGALSASTWTGAQARPFGLLLGGGLHHLGGFGGLRPLGGFGGGLRPPGFGRGFYGGPGYRGFASAGETRRWGRGSGRERYWGAYAAPLAVGATGAYYGYARTDSDNGAYPAYRYSDYPAYRN